MTETKKNIKNELTYSAAIPALSAVATSFLLTSLLFGSLNPLRWNQNIEKETKRRQAYFQLYDKALRCVEQDGIPGLNLNELGELYSRAGVNVYYNPRVDGGIERGKIFLPGIPKENLEKVVKSCEVSEGK